ncbi:protein serine/threonine phosphatase 2C [Fistulina hepatica ATCC 64428]|uniref:Protein serine/threonine phosphatase 2C n=1 Tax=Fistulina hepatica ATCC 64428 TaxID=1128425 RepID=A0A0D7AHJ4_9AGAR|nr:protein serine/threonine phosphatase 2C [Fistulina hepatica ATCC 64428]
MLRNAWRPIAAVGVTGVAGYYVYSKFRESRVEEFRITVRTRNAEGKSEMKNIPLTLLSMSAVERRLVANAASHTTTRPGGIIWKHTTASLASNDPIEDRSAHQIIERDPSDASAPGDLLFYSVFDGHSGFHTSDLLSHVLIRAVAFEFSKLVKRRPSQHDSWSSRIVGKLPSPFWSEASPADADPKRVSTAIQSAFTNLDAGILDAPVKLLIDKIGDKKNIVPDLSKISNASQYILPALSGSCALMAIIDTAHNNMYVACTGDSRAVTGIWEPSDDGSSGIWRVDVLSKDQTGRNPSELQRIQSEHPPSERDAVVRRGRILGGLEPSRAFGDARYKWPVNTQTALHKAYFEALDQAKITWRMPPENYLTPPYVTANPVVTHRKIFGGGSTSKLPVRFVVLATDGLWDELSSTEVVSLVAGHFAGLKGIVPKSELSTRVPTSFGESRGVEGKQKRRQSEGGGSWAFVDENVSTHLIRNAFGGGDTERLRKLVSIPAPYSRRFRDDITVTVVWWEEGREDAAQTAQSKL